VLFFAGRLWTGAAIYGILAASLLLALLVDPHQPDRAMPDLFAVAAALINLVLGLLFLLWPGSFAATSYAPIRGILPLAGAAGIIGGVALIMPNRRGTWADPKGLIRPVLGSVLPVLLVYTFVRSGLWTGVGSWGSFALAHVFRRGWLAPIPPLTATPQQRSLADYHSGIAWWSWILVLAFVLLAAIGGAGAIAGPAPLTLLVLGISIYNVVDWWVFPKVAGLPARILGQLTFLTAAVGVLYVGAGAAGRVLLALLAVLPPLAVRTLGRRAGFGILLMGTFMVFLSPLLGMWLTGTAPIVALTRFLMDLLLLGAAAGIGLTTTIQQSRLMEDLENTQVRLADQVAALQARDEQLQSLTEELQAQADGLECQHAALQTQTEQLQAQQEELQAQNEELLAQGAALSSQRDQLKEALDRTREAAEARDRLIAILEATPDYVALDEADGRRIFINQAGRRLLEIADDAPAEVGLTAESYPEWVRQLVALEGYPAAYRDGYWRGETALLTRSGREIPVSQVILAHKSADGVIQHFSTIIRDMSERKEIEAQLLHLASYDPLTDLFNRRRFQEELEQQLAQAKRYGRRGALLYLDLDQFKCVNDTMGHKAGDDLLKSIAGLLRQRLRKTDTVARLGGDEFAVLLPEVEALQAEEIAGTIIRAIQGHREVFGQRAFAVTGSIGIALFPDHGIAAGDLMARADMAMYQAKDRGRNRYACYTPDSAGELQMEKKVTAHPEDS